jgi:hypothetical protein
LVLLGSRRKASGHRDATVGSAWADLARDLAETQDSTLRVQLHLLQRRLLIFLLSALTHHGLQGEKTGIMEYWDDGVLLKQKHLIIYTRALGRINDSGIP